MTRVQYIIGGIYYIRGENCTILSFSQKCATYETGDFADGTCRGCPGRIVYEYNGTLTEQCGYSNKDQIFRFIEMAKGYTSSNSRW